jgi:nitrate/nitrite-specific signal transduction histidine kinase
VVLRIWPTPTAAEAGTLRMQVHRLAADSNDGTKTVDLERYWTLCLTYRLAQHIAGANSLNPGRVQYFMNVADKYEENCKSYSAQKAPSRFVAAHRTGWSRR